MIYLIILVLLIVSLITKNFVIVITFVTTTSVLVFLYEIRNKKQNEISVINETLLLQELEESREKYKFTRNLLKLSNSVDIGIIQLDNNGCIEYFNQTFKKYFAEDIQVGSHHKKIGNDELKKVLVYSLIVGSTSTTEHIGEKYYEVKYIPIIVNEKSQGVLIQFYDVTFLKEFDNYQRIFLTDISHELRNPLTAIKMASEMIVSEETTEIGQILNDEVERMTVLVEDLFNLSKLQSGMEYEFTTFNLSELCERFNKYCTLKNQEFYSSIDTDIYIRGNYNLIDRMITNIIENGYKYNQSGYVKLSLKTLNDKVIIRIDDNGIGIEKNDLEHIFERFYRVDKSRTRETGGTGLGLAIVAEIVNMHDGVIEVVSEKNIGTSFIIEFEKAS